MYGWIGSHDHFIHASQLHVATLTGLAPNTRYFYQVGDPTFTYWSDPEWSQPPYMNFVTRPLNLNATRAIIFGTMQALNALKLTADYSIR